METEGMGPQDYIEILQQRKWGLLLPAIVIFLIAVIVAILLPPVYKSVSTILIEDQTIPIEYVSSKTANFAEQRIQNIKHRIMSSAKLIEIINEYNLYEGWREKLTTDEIVAKMRKDIIIETINAEGADNQTGMRGATAIAFTVSYEGNDPEKVYEAGGKITSLFIEEDSQLHKKQTEDTASFIEDEKNKIREKLEECEATVSKFKREHLNELPEMIQVNIQGLHDAENNLEKAKEELRGLKERLVYLEVQIENIPAKLEREKKLEELQLKLAQLESKFSDEHPDVKKIKDEIAAVRKSIYGSKGSERSEFNKADNPAYIALSSEIVSTKSNIDSLERHIAVLMEQKELFTKRIAATPKVEEELSALDIERRTTQSKYDDLLRKLLESGAARGLEKEQKGDRLTVIDPATFPEKPYKPNRLAIVLIGLILGVGAGVGNIAFLEFSDNTVRSARELTRDTSFQVLAKIPFITTEKEIKRRKRIQIAALSGVILVLAASLAIYHYRVMDLTTLWHKLMHRLFL